LPCLKSFKKLYKFFPIGQNKKRGNKKKHKKTKSKKGAPAITKKRGRGFFLFGLPHKNP